MNEIQEIVKDQIEYELYESGDYNSEVLTDEQVAELIAEASWDLDHNEDFWDALSEKIQKSIRQFASDYNVKGLIKEED
jgi:hypothetical protein